MRICCCSSVSKAVSHVPDGDDRAGFEMIIHVCGKPRASHARACPWDRRPGGKNGDRLLVHTCDSGCPMLRGANTSLLAVKVVTFALGNGV